MRKVTGALLVGAYLCLALTTALVLWRGGGGWGAGVSGLIGVLALAFSVQAIVVRAVDSNALRGEGFPFEVMTPSNALRLVPDRNRDEGLTLELDAENDPPAVLLSVTKGRGSRMTRTEQAVKDGAAPDQITSEDLETLLVDAVKPWPG